MRLYMLLISPACTVKLAFWPILGQIFNIAFIMAFTKSQAA